MKNSLYARLSKIKFLLKSYTFKFLFIAFLGIHIPLTGFIFFIIFRQGSLPAATIFTVTLLLTLAASTVTILILKSLLIPLNQSRAAMEQYIPTKKQPDLPTTFQDEGGILMRKVQETVTRLDRLLEEKKDLIAILSHDLRTPLANIKLLGGLIGKEKISNEELQAISELICKSADEQIMLLNKVLQGLRQEDIDPMDLDLNETAADDIIAHALGEVKQLAIKKDITFKINNHYKGTLNVAQSLFPQVIKNLLSNSIKFSHPGSIVNLDVNKPNEKIKIEIKDTGIGFNPRDAEVLFQKFTTKGRKGTLNEPSTGMGLYLSRKIIEAHKGKLYAKSEGVNKGANFIIEL